MLKAELIDFPDGNGSNMSFCIIKQSGQMVGRGSLLSQSLSEILILTLLLSGFMK